MQCQPADQRAGTFTGGHGDDLAIHLSFQAANDSQPEHTFIVDLIFAALTVD